MTAFTGYFSVVLYFLASALCVRMLRVSSDADESARRALLCGALGVILHGWLLPALIIKNDGIAVGLSQSVSLFGWQCALLLCVIAMRQPLIHLGAAIFPAAAIGALAMLWWPDPSRVISQAPWTTGAHIVLSMLAWGLLTIAALQAIATAIQDRQLSNARPTSAALPPLQTMESLLFQILTAGFFTLSLSLLSGLFFVEDMFAQHLVHKTLFSLTAWLLFAVLLWGRWHSGWRGRQALKWTLAGYAALILAYFGSKLVLEIFLGRHWATGA